MLKDLYEICKSVSTLGNSHNFFKSSEKLFLQLMQQQCQESVAVKFKKISSFYLIFFKADQNPQDSGKSQEIVTTDNTPPYSTVRFYFLTALQSFQCVIVNH